MDRFRIPVPGSGRVRQAALRDAAPADLSPCPLVVFSHGNSGLRRQSTFLTTHLASWGFVVAAPDHTGNTFEEMMQLESQEERSGRSRTAAISAGVRNSIIETSPSVFPRLISCVSDDIVGFGPVGTRRVRRVPTRDNGRIGQLMVIFGHR